METAKPKSHWSHADNFGGAENEYIKSFVHHNYSIGYHTHSFYELNIVINGRGEHLIEKRKKDVERGCVFMIPPGIRHSYKNSEGLNVYHMLIHRDFIPVCFGEFKKTSGFSLLFEIEPYLRARYQENMFLTLNEAELNAVLSDVELLSVCEGIPDAQLYVNAIAKKVLAFLCMCIMRQSGLENVRAKPSRELLCIADSLNYIHLNYDEKLTVEALAERHNMSRATYIRWFSKTCGCSPHQYIVQYRLKKAEEELASPRSSISDVAQRCGFYDASHLRRALTKKQSE